jgi:hypothetical protein
MNLLIFASDLKFKQKTDILTRENLKLKSDKIVYDLKTDEIIAPLALVCIAGWMGKPIE